MQLYCSACQLDVTNNIAVYENVDGVLVHCGECNFPILAIGYDEPNWFGNMSASEGEEEVMSEKQLSLFDNDVVCDSCDPAECTCDVQAAEDSQDSECCEEGCSCDSPAPTLPRVAFTSEDLIRMERSLSKSVKRLRTTLDNTYETLDKVQTLLELRKCL